MIVNTKFSKNSGLGTAMFSRAGKTTINQYISFADGSKNEEIEEPEDPEDHREYFVNYEGAFGNKLIQQGELPDIEKMKKEEIKKK